jgi:Zn-dependent peptidase ImmA (M78 family)/transcriptional regulator with XRE-family HTH domain
MEALRINPARVRLAREIKGLTKAALGNLIGVSPTTISSIEHGNLSGNAYAERLSLGLKQPISFFLAPIPDDLDPRVEFRSLRSTRQMVKATVQAKAMTAILNVEPVVSKTVGKRIADWPDLSLVNPAEAADAVRSWLQIGNGPIQSDLLAILENAGLRTYWYEDPTDKTVGMSFWHLDTPFVFIKSAGQSAQRDNWTLAHELGHLVLHLSDRARENELCEDEANEFARNFLFPKGIFVKDVGNRVTEEMLLNLKEKYRTSIAAIVKTMRSYEVITDSQYHFAFKRISQRNWRKREPGDNPPQNSHVLMDFVYKVTNDFDDAEEFATNSLHISSNLAKELVPPMELFGVLSSMHQ